MQDKIRQQLQVYQRQAQGFAAQLRDVRFAGLMLFLVIVLLISWSGVKSIQSNYELQKKISNLQQQNSLQQLSNSNLKLENGYYSTDSYLDLQARLNFGLAAPGEKEIIVPKAVALGYAPAKPKDAQQVDKPIDKQPSYQRNFEAWVDFFLHRQSTTN